MARVEGGELTYQVNIQKKREDEDPGKYDTRQ